MHRNRNIAGQEVRQPCLQRVLGRMNEDCHRDDSAVFGWCRGKGRTRGRLTLRLLRSQHTAATADYLMVFIDHAFHIVPAFPLMTFLLCCLASFRAQGCAKRKNDRLYAVDMVSSPNQSSGKWRILAARVGSGPALCSVILSRICFGRPRGNGVGARDVSFLSRLGVKRGSR